MQSKEARRQARREMVRLMLDGLSWREASEQAGIPFTRSGAQKIVRRVRKDGESALDDRRHGHPSKIRGEMRDWLERYCHENLLRPSHEVQAELEKSFGLQVSVSQVNRVRKALGLSRPQKSHLPLK